MALLRMTWALATSILLLEASTVSAQSRIICTGEAAGGYAAFPDICRLHNGDLFCVFYSGYGHVSTPMAKWPKGGRIMAVRSSDNGQSWSPPVVIIDSNHDDRDPSVACLKDGTLLLNWFTPRPDQPDKEAVEVLLARSSDQGKTWSQPVKLNLQSPYLFACSSPVRELTDGSLILGLYRETTSRTWPLGPATIKSYDGGKTWRNCALIGEKAGIYLDAETDVVPLTDGGYWQPATFLQGGHALCSFAGSGQDLGARALVRLQVTALTSCDTAAASSCSLIEFQLRHCIGRAMKGGVL